MSKLTYKTPIKTTPEELKKQIILALNDIVTELGGEHYFFGEDEYTTGILKVYDTEIHGLMTEGKGVTFMCVVDDYPWSEEEYYPADANDFHIEDIWEIYNACLPFYEAKIKDNGNK